MPKARSVPPDSNSNKMNDCVQVNLRITTNSNQGGRKYMEDAYAIALQRLTPSDKESPISLAYFGIFDGHGGKEAAEFARQHLCQRILEQDDFWPSTNETSGTSEAEDDERILSAIRKGFLACHADMWNDVGKWAKTSSGLPSTSGCTASVVFVRGNKLYIGHVGDSAIVLGEGESLYKTWSAHRLTRDHKPEDPSELKRIRESGGNVLCKAGVHRVVWNRQKMINSASSSSHHYRHHHHHHHHHRHPHSITTTTTTTSAGTTIEYEQIPFLAVSRALGDLWSLNKSTNLYSVSPEPELTVIEIDPVKHRCLILASDGLWNMMTPESAVEIVRSCDVKTEEMILKAEDDDHRPFRNPSHELVQKALTSWRERMLRADNITCVTVMLDPPGPPFSDCIVNKKKQMLTCSMSSSTASVCSDDTVELDHPTMMVTNNTAAATTTTTTPQRPKPTLQRKEHILTPISNGPTPVRTPKRPASDDAATLLVDTPRRKLIKTNQQKENGTSSPSPTAATGSNESEPISPPSLSRPMTSNNEEEEEEEDDQPFAPLTQQAPVLSMFDDDEGIRDDLARQVEQCFRDNNSEHDQQLHQSDANVMHVDEPNNPSQVDDTHTTSKPKSSSRRRSRFRFSLSNTMSQSDQESASSRSRRTRSASTPITNDNQETNDSEIKSKSTSSRRRKSYSSIGIISDVKIASTVKTNNNSEQESAATTNIDKKSMSTSSKIKSSFTNLTSKQSLANRVKRVFRPHRGSPSSRRVATSAAAAVSSSSLQ